MYWMLLPLDANAARQLSTEADLPNGTWTHWFRVYWTTIVQVFRGPRD
jgi:hypothetical protein